jgi:hypothetical protein
MTNNSDNCEHCVKFSHHNCSDLKEEYIVTKGNGKILADSKL